MSAAAVIALRRRKFIRRFREHDATLPDRAIPFAEVGMRRSWIFDQMVSRGVFVHVGDDRYWMNQPVAEEFRAEKRRRALIVTMVFLVIGLIVLVAVSRW